jgi:hypothetical protein
MGIEGSLYKIVRDGERSLWWLVRRRLRRGLHQTMRHLSRGVRGGQRTLLGSLPIGMLRDVWHPAGIDASVACVRACVLPACLLRRARPVTCPAVLLGAPAVCHTPQPRPDGVQPVSRAGCMGRLPHRERVWAAARTCLARSIFDNDRKPYRPMKTVPARRLSRLAALLLPLLAAAGCASSVKLPQHHESFDSTTTYARSFAASEMHTCEAARRALLSQGYFITVANADLVSGRKGFQPERELHVEVEFRVVCAAEGAAPGQGGTIAFVSAVQDRFALKRSNSAASVGVGAIGSLSLPMRGSDDSLVKVASETISAAPFYDRFFTLLQRYLPPQATEPVRPPG